MGDDLERPSETTRTRARPGRPPGAGCEAFLAGAGALGSLPPTARAWAASRIVGASSASSSSSARPSARESDAPWSAWAQRRQAARGCPARHRAQAQLSQAGHLQSAGRTATRHAPHVSVGPAGSGALPRALCTCPTVSSTREASCWTSCSTEAATSRANSSQYCLPSPCAAGPCGFAANHSCCRARAASGLSDLLGESSSRTRSCPPCEGEGEGLVRPTAPPSQLKRPEKASLPQRGTSPFSSCSRISAPRASRKGSSWARRKTMVTPDAQMSTLWS
mmetsp:Transcript_46703/g.137951  ORF Transcript_46703/g.137951 Transcript_46703/m.137951 type:complete len:278 (-) Transcript_46703:746-1579(-)